jgi:hypothetical protein
MARRKCGRHAGGSCRASPGCSWLRVGCGLKTGERGMTSEAPETSAKSPRTKTTARRHLHLHRGCFLCPQPQQRYQNSLQHGVLGCLWGASGRNYQKTFRGSLSNSTDPVDPPPLSFIVSVQPSRSPLTCAATTAQPPATLPTASAPRNAWSNCSQLILRPPRLLHSPLIPPSRPRGPPPRQSTG